MEGQLTKWYTGNYEVLEGVKKVGTVNIRQGDIIVHESGAVILRCPACAAMQFGHAKVMNSPKTPSFDRPLQCGSGHCKRCGVWFTIKNGKAEEAEPTEPRKRELPKKLTKAGVKRPPKLKLEEK